MILYCLLAGLRLILPFLPLNLVPFVKRGRAFNAQFVLYMPAQDGSSTSLGNRWLPVFAQELVEDWISWAVALLAGFGIAWLVAYTEIAFLSPIAGLFVALLAWQWRNSRWGLRETEYWGHAAEQVVAWKMGLPKYSTLEVATNLQGSYGNLFDNKTITNIMDAISNRRRFVRILVFLFGLRLWRNK